MKAFKGGAISAAKSGGRMFHIGALLNYIDLAQFPDGTVLLATEEGYIISEQDNYTNFITEE